MRRDLRDKRIAIFLPSLSGGGAERFAVNLVKGLAEHGYLVDLVLASARGPYLSRVPSTSAVSVVDLKVRLGSGGLALAVFPLRRYLSQARPHFLVSIMTASNVVALSARRLSNTDTRVIVTEHTTLSQVVANGALKRASILLSLARATYPQAYRIIAVSRGVAQDLTHTLGVPPERVQVIYNPIVTQELNSKAQEPVSHPWFSPGQPPVILAVGRLTRAKNYQTLVHAFAQVKRQRNVKLMILGEGEDRPNLEALVRGLGLDDDVALPGFVDNPYSYMAKASLLVLSSVWEGLPTVLVEALACGTPVVSTECPSGPSEILENGKYGPLVPVGDAEALASAILATMAAPLSPDVLREGARRFSEDSVIAQYLEVLADKRGSRVHNVLREG